MKDAALGDITGLRVGVCLGTTVASQLNDLDFYRSYRISGECARGSGGQISQGEYR